MTFGEFANPIKVAINNFYGIEINDFAVTVARTALWIAENQMMRETEDIIHMNLDFLPLTTNACIVEGNALRMDWEEVVPKERLRYIMGNPPFVGHQWRTKAQADDMDCVFFDLKKHGKLDYVCAWYKKAADFMLDTDICAAFVSTNSVVQGETVAILWKYLFENKNVEIQFAYQPFVWDSEASQKAHVHCVIIGFSNAHRKGSKVLFASNEKSARCVDYINGYLLDAPDVFIQSRGKRLADSVPPINKGSQPTDGGFLILSEEEKDELLSKYPEAGQLVRQFMGSYELINNKRRYCLWLKDKGASEYRKIPMILERIEKVADFRRHSATESVRRDAEIPMLFTQIRQPDSDYLALPKVSSERRRYIPIAYLKKEIIASDLIYTISDATSYLFAVLNSNVHMAWMRVVCGRLKSDYRYGPVVYNNFPWPSPSDEQRAMIEKTGQGILDARKLYPEESLADLYDPLTMPPELRKAHIANDKAVMQAYGMPVRETDEAACVAWLMRLYQEKVEMLEGNSGKKK